ncbi:MAG: histidine kinase dimerization/phospho-acceptor domain-containing protein [Pseudomonadota bacterium]
MSNFEDIYHHLPQCILVCEQDSVVISVNHATENLFTRNASSLCNQKLDELFAADCALINLVKENGLESVFAPNFQITSPYFTDRQANITLTRLGEQTLITIAPLAIFGDPVQIDTSIMGNLWGYLLHEVRTPLAVIQASVQILRDGLDKQQEHELYYAIEDGAKRIGNLVARMEIFSTATSVTPKACNIHKVLSRCIKDARLAYAPDITIREEYDPSLPEIMVPEGHLYHVIDNILGNASEALHKTPHGHIHVSTQYRIGYSTRISGKNSNPHLPITLTISDNGPGISPKIQKSLFQPSSCCI